MSDPKKSSNESYFSQLNYTLGNEDTEVEMNFVRPTDRIIGTIAGSGSRVIPLAIHGPKHIYCFDFSRPQLFLTELRIVAAKHLDREDYIGLFGFAGHDTSTRKRQTLFKELPLSLDARAYLEQVFIEVGWQSLLFLGKWERTMIKLSKLLQKVVGKDLHEVFKFTDLEEQAAFVDTKFPRWRFELALRVLGNAQIFNKLLYKGSFPKNNSGESYFDLYRKSFYRMLRLGLARENFFIQLCFLGALRYPEGNPCEVDKDVFLAIKRGLQKCEVSYMHGDLFDRLSTMDHRLNFFSFSDVPSYFQDETERNFLQMLSPYLEDNARVANRYYLHHPQDPNRDNFRLDRTLVSKFEREKVGVYKFDFLEFSKSYPQGVAKRPLNLV